MGRLKAIKGLGKAYEANINRTKDLKTQTRNIETSKMFEKANTKKTVTAPETQTRNIETSKMFEKANTKKELSKGEKALRDFKKYFREAEKTPEMKAYRKEQNFPKPKYSKEDFSMKKYKEKLKNEKNKK